MSLAFGMAAGAALGAAGGLALLGLRPGSAGLSLSLTTWFVLVFAPAAAVLFDRRPASVDASRLRLSFVAEAVTLLLAGPSAMLVASLAGAAARVLLGRPRPPALRAAMSVLVCPAGTAGVSGVAYAAVIAVSGHDGWPWRALPLSLAAALYAIVLSVVLQVLLPLTDGRPVERAWPRAALRAIPLHLVGAAVAAGLAEAIALHAWPILTLAVIPLFVAWSVYNTHADQAERLLWSRATTASHDQPAAVVDGQGQVVLWNDALAQMLECPGSNAIGRQLGDACSQLVPTELLRALADALQTRTPKTVAAFGVRVGAGVRVLSVTIVPDAEGAMLLWRDVTEQQRVEATLRQSVDRFALMVEGANDGLWEWDQRTQMLYVSARWAEMVGLPAAAATGPREAWFERVHPDDLPGLIATFDAQLACGAGLFEHEHRIRHEDGGYRRALCRGTVVQDSRRRTSRVAGSLTDITESALARARIQCAAFTDTLTGLCNRAAFVSELGQQLQNYKDRRGSRFAALYLDLDRFKVVNDSLGHLIGDELLVAVSRRLESCLRPGDVIARLGGDEFAIMLQGIGDEGQASVVAFRIQEKLSAPFSIGGLEVVTSASIGIACSRVEYTSAEEIMRDADTAMYYAKSHGKARHELFDADMHARSQDRLGLESDLRIAVKNYDFEVHYQPIVSLASRMCVGFESLVRWQRNGKAVSPADFIPIAEELGLIDALGTRVFEEACQTFMAWRRRFPEGGLECITVNVSPRQLMQQGFPLFVEQTVQAIGMKPAELRLEITETALLDAPQQAAHVLGGLREFGVKIYLDDFGTGYSSLSHLHRLPVDALKIDRSFVRGLLQDDRPAIVESILALARTLHTSVVAEGVEEEGQADQLERLGCQLAQGYYFSRPQPAATIEQMLMLAQPLGGPRTPPVERLAALTLLGRAARAERASQRVAG